jgi:hypothetical protein
MNPESISAVTKVTPLSKALAAILFIAMPFVGLYIGYTYAPEKVVEVERVVERIVYENVVTSKSNFPHINFESLSTKELSFAKPVNIKFVNGTSTDSRAFLQNDGAVFVYTNIGFSGEPGLVKLPVTDIGNLTFLYSGYLGEYISDGSKVFYVGTFSPSVLRMDGVDVSSFEYLDIDFTADSTSVYLRGEKLVGVGPDSVQFVEERGYTFMVAGNRAWAPHGCVPVVYEEIPFTDISTHSNC